MVLLGALFPSQALSPLYFSARFSSESAFFGSYCAFSIPDISSKEIIRIFCSRRMGEQKDPAHTYRNYFLIFLSPIINAFLFCCPFSGEGKVTFDLFSRINNHVKASNRILLFEQSSSGNISIVNQCIILKILGNLFLLLRAQLKKYLQNSNRKGFRECFFSDNNVAITAAGHLQ